jgi:hypothetical protein
VAAHHASHPSGDSSSRAPEAARGKQAPRAAASPALLAYLSQHQHSPGQDSCGAAQDGGGSDKDVGRGDQDQQTATVPSALLAFKDQLLAARLQLHSGAWRLSSAAQNLLAALLRYRDGLLPLAGAGSGASWRGVSYMASRCGAALTLVAADPQLDDVAVALVLEDLRLTAQLTRLPVLEGTGRN